MGHDDPTAGRPDRPIEDRLAKGGRRVRVVIEVPGVAVGKELAAVVDQEQDGVRGDAELAKKLEKTSIAVAVKTGEGGKLFGAVTANDLHDKLAAAGLQIEKRRIHLGQPVKTLGKHEVKIKLHPEVTVELSFEVVSENPIEPANS